MEIFILRPTLFVYLRIKLINISLSYLFPSFCLKFSWYHSPIFSNNFYILNNLFILLLCPNFLILISFDHNSSKSMQTLIWISSFNFWWYHYPIILMLLMELFQNIIFFLCPCFDTSCPNNLFWQNLITFRGLFHRL